MQIIKYPLNEGQYFKQEAKKTQIVLHHTASNGDAKNVVNGWNIDPRKIGTAYVIDREGQIFEAFNAKYWAAHIGYYIEGLGGNDEAYKIVPNSNNKPFNLSIELRTIGIEFTNWGNLTLKNGKYYSYVNTIIPENEVVKLDKPFRGSIYYQNYTPKQIFSTMELIKDLGAKFNIPLKFSQSFEFDKNAVLGVPGIVLHSNFRMDKSDIFPQMEMKDSLSQFI